jgi:hypothetical protein
MLHILGGFIFHFHNICKEEAQETHRQAGDPGDQKPELDAKPAGKRTATQKFNMERRKHHPLQEGLQSGPGRFSPSGKGLLFSTEISRAGNRQAI